MTEHTTPRHHFHNLCAGLILAGTVFASLPHAQIPGIGGGMDLTSVANQGGGAPAYSPNLGNLPTLPPPGMWNSPLLPDQKPVFEAIDETTYVVGPGDYFHIGIGAQVFNLVVSPEGYLLLESVPPVNVNGKTLLEARTLVVEAASGHFQGDRVHVRLAQAKRFQTTIAGAVNRPGIYGVDPGIRVSNLLEIAGGFSVRSSREIALHRATGEVEHIDLRGFYLEGDMESNPVVRQGDRLLVGSLEGSDPIVYVREQNNLLSMRHRDGETLEEFVLRYDGYRDVREWRYARIYDESGRYAQTVQRTDSESHGMRAGTTVELHAPKPLVFVGGMVMRPGYFEYNPTLSAMDYLALSGMTVHSASARRITVVDDQGRRRSVNTTGDPLRPGDHILVPRSYEATFRDHIAIISAISSLAVAIATFVVLTSN